MNAVTQPDLSPRMYALYFLAIAISTPFILFPTARLLPYAKLGIGVVVAAMFVAIVRRGMRNGELTRTLPQIYAQASAGRRIAGLTLQTAAVTAISLAMWLIH